jgi:hypothetical protein
MHGSTAQAGEQEEDRYQQQAKNLPFAEFGIHQWILSGSVL